MSPREAWTILMERCSHGARSDEDRLIVADALAVAAGKMGLANERATCEALADAIRKRDAAQLKFEDLLKSHAADGPDGRTP